MQNSTNSNIVGRKSVWWVQYLVCLNLDVYGYHPVKRTPGLWKNKTRRTTFTLVVDNFGVQSFSKEDADHLFTSTEANYPVKTDWTGSK